MLFRSEGGFGWWADARASKAASECTNEPVLLPVVLFEVVGSRSATRSNNSSHTWDLGTTTTTSGMMSLKATRCRSSAARHRQFGIRLGDQPITFPSTLPSRHQPTTTTNQSRTNEYCIELNSEIFTRYLALLFKVTLMWLMLMC